jgi:hypothetical protein
MQNMKNPVLLAVFLPHFLRLSIDYGEANGLE